MKPWMLASHVPAAILVLRASAASAGDIVLRPVGNTVAVDEVSAPLGDCLRKQQGSLQLERCAIGSPGDTRKNESKKPFYSIYVGTGNSFARFPVTAKDKPSALEWDQVMLVDEQDAKLPAETLWDKCRGVDKPDEVSVVVRAYRGRSSRRRLSAVIEDQTAAIGWPQDAPLPANVGGPGRYVIFEFAPLSAVCAPAAAARIKASEEQIEKLKREKQELDSALRNQIADTERAVADAKAKADAALTSKELLAVLKAYVATLETQASELREARKQLQDKVTALEAELEKKKQLEKDQQRISPQPSAGAAPTVSPAGPAT